jgi:hypothetical protein
VLPLLVGGSLLIVLGVYLVPREVADSAAPKTSAIQRIRFADALKLAHSPSFLLFLVAAAAIQSSHALYYAFGSIHGARWALPTVPSARFGPSASWRRSAYSPSRRASSPHWERRDCSWLPALRPRFAGA